MPLGKFAAPSRVIFGAHETNLGDGRAFSDRHVAYYRRRAEGGVGVIVTEDASVHHSDWPYERAPLASECGPGWAAIAAACTRSKTLVIAGLGHAGGQGTSHWSQRELWAPSRVPETNTREVPKWMELADVDAVVDGFVAAALLAVDSGCAGVEINAGQFSLVRQFLSGLTNHRSDQWADRTAFARAVISGVRAAVGPDALVGLRLSCDELAPWAGITPEMGAELAADLATEIDYVTVVRGSIYSAGATRPDAHTEPGFNLELARTVRDAVRDAHADRVAVIAQGSIVDADQAEWALSDGIADGVEMTRALLADAALVTKARRGEVGRIRPCVLCNQTCQVRDNRNPVVTCIADPSTGYELTEPEPLPAAHLSEPGRSVLVIGGGPAGMEAARTAADAGHRVTLVDRSAELGGMVNVAAQMPAWSRLRRLTAWLAGECVLAGVTIELDKAIDTGDGPEAFVGGFDQVILATGGVPGAPLPIAAGVTAADGQAVDASGLLRAWSEREASDGGSGDRSDQSETESPPKSALIWDPIGGPIGVAVAQLLADAGVATHLVTPDQIVGNELARSGDLGPANARLAQRGVTMHRRSVLVEVTEAGATIRDRFSGEITEIEADLVVDAGHRMPDPAAERFPADWSRAGDCVAPRTIYQAILEGRRAGAAITGHSVSGARIGAHS